MTLKKIGIISLFALLALGGISGMMLVGYIIIVHSG
ncbi:MULTISPECIES: membrane protein [Pectobacterium]|uniref:UPF0387 membrane protein YohO n=1 Tax=Pectobacterium versatile TaxID=2488639 RepID=A0A855MFQ8_9GAMM|nr:MULTISPECIES: membrane protein [Pectobacterium]GKW35597.1 hypothetical protein PEC730217_43770 [Pectobacterium carotovorum subsp. carotovorum]KFX18534.1 membrane protein [Pectobacterium parvum]KHS94580.1 membrane protein [Pectobacterium parvum]MCA6928466.1 hypothetical protein [Pectobacterium versatile]MCA6943349.1 hypothetical protein [Pectobacterium polaris]